MENTTLSLAKLNRASDTEFELTADAALRAEIARDLDLPKLKKLRLSGRLHPEGKRDWHLQASLGATAVQTCVVTLEPVNTRVDIPVERRYLQTLPKIAEEDAEMPEDDTLEPLPNVVDLADLAAEALSLALPDFPRAPGVALGDAVFAAPGVKPMTDEDAKPLAGLAALKDAMSGRKNDP